MTAEAPIATLPLSPPVDADLNGAPSSSAVIDPPQSGDAIAEAPIPEEALAATDAPLVSPEADAVRAALDAFLSHASMNPIGAGDWGAAKTAIQAFYTARGFAPVWTSEGALSPAGARVLDRLRKADEDGLSIGRMPLPKESWTPASATDVAEADIAISAAVVAYAEEASGARLAPRRLSALLDLEPAVVDPGKALAAVAAADDPGEALRSVNPAQPGYARLRDELAKLRAEALSAASVPPGPTLRLGMSDPRVALIRSRLGIDAEPLSSPELYDTRVAAAVATFQRSAGLPVSGAFTPATHAALDGGAKAGEAAIIANMEMWRWQPHEPEPTRIEINIPDFMLSYYRDGELGVHERTIVGKPETPTAIFSNAVRYLLVNPAWRVPDSIINKEFLPKLAEDPDYLTKHGFEVTMVGDRMVVKQPPGAANALGRILFMFPNDHAIYLHDTPARGLFAGAFRAFSHGCIRLEAPFKLAELLFNGDARYSAQRLEAMIGGQERTIPLPQPVPIHIVYFTRFADEDGELQRREDLYGLAKIVAGTLSRISQD